MNANDLTHGGVFKNLVRFSLPYLLSCFLQTFYGLADLFITGQFNGASAITAVSVGSQVTHMLTVIIVGLAMGSTVAISRSVGAGDRRAASSCIGSTAVIFTVFSLAATALLLLFTDGILAALSTPAEAVPEARQYLTVCFAGVPFITAYNVISSIFRGLGDTKRPMYFVAVAGVVNVGLDYLLIGPMGMGAMGAALATVLAQGLSVVMALACMARMELGVSLSKEGFRGSHRHFAAILKVGLPIALQDGLIQIAFLVITVIANKRGLDVAAAVGIVEKVICFLFLVPSAMLSSVSAIAAQNAGAGFHQRSSNTLACGIGISMAVGAVFAVLCQVWAEPILRLFAREEPLVIAMGAQYLRAYVLDCVIAGVHFCFSGYFCAYQRPLISFGHNLASILLVRIPGAYLASLWFPDSLYPMGLAAPLGSLLSSIICVAAYAWLTRRGAWEDRRE